MLVSWEWLADYVAIDGEPHVWAERLSLSGLNHEASHQVDGDTVLDLEVTSNRGDCLSHIGVARELAALAGTTWKQPAVAPVDSPVSDKAGSAGLAAAGAAAVAPVRVRNAHPTGCRRYAARLVEGLQVGESPDWLQRRLKAVGIKPVNNVVDVTNYVMLECGQPLHAFDFDKLVGGELVVRPAAEGEQLEAIDHRTYSLDPTVMVIADSQRPLAIAGIMGGADSEISTTTVRVAIESADFSSDTVRQTARKLRLHSPASHRFERRVDPDGIEWALDRCCQLLVQMAGGVLVGPPVVDPPRLVGAREPVCLRQRQLARVLGIELPWQRGLDILQTLGCRLERCSEEDAWIVPPSWRHDLTREIDLVEEIARIHGYDAIPEQALVPLSASARPAQDRLIDRLRQVLLAAGFFEALTPSLVSQSALETVRPWSQQAPLQTQVPLLEGARCLRQSLIPSLLAAAAYNQQQSQIGASLFEVANLYVPAAAEQAPLEQRSLGLVTPRSARWLRGVLEALLVQGLGIGKLSWEDGRRPGLVAGSSRVGLRDSDQPLVIFGQLDPAASAALRLRGDWMVAELNLQHLLSSSRLVPQLRPINPYPEIVRDLNLLLPESVRWSQLERVVEQAAGPLLSQLRYRETYRDPQRDGADRKRVLLALHLQAADQTLTGQQADQLVATVVEACGRQLQAILAG
jgi:phenylalanyl-tRNA synthetase beta chain